MTDKNKALIVTILDRSGSMNKIASDMVGGYTRFIEEQKAQPGICEVSLYQFDDLYETVYECKPIAEVPELKLEPRSSTALWDAVGRSIVHTGKSLLATPEDQRPGVVVVMIITDGHENASKEYKPSHVRAMIEKQEKEYNWRFVYLGATAAGLKDAQGLGIKTKGMYQANAAGVQHMYSETSRSIGSLRSAVRGGNANAPLDVDLSKKS
jgi:hypothetical protein